MRVKKGVLVLMGKLRQGAEQAAAACLPGSRERGEQSGGLWGRGAARRRRRRGVAAAVGVAGPGAVTCRAGEGRVGGARAGEPGGRAGGRGAGAQPHFLCFSSLSLLLALLSVWLLGLLLRYILSMALRASVR